MMSLVILVNGHKSLGFLFEAAVVFVFVIVVISEYCLYELHCYSVLFYEFLFC